MANHSRNRCERHRWVEGAWDHWSALLPSSVSNSVASLHTGSARLAFLILVSLLCALLLGAVGALSDAQAETPIFKFDSGNKVQQLRVSVNKSDTIRLERPFAYLHPRDTISLSAGDAVAYNRAVHTIDPWPATSREANHTTDGKRILLGMERYQNNESLEPQGMGVSDRFEDESNPPPAAPPAP